MDLSHTVMSPETGSLEAPDARVVFGSLVGRLSIEPVLVLVPSGSPGAALPDLEVLPGPRSTSVMGSRRSRSVHTGADADRLDEATRTNKR
jgi:hypothetical protein